MKKVVLAALLAVLGLAVADASAWNRGYYRNGGYCGRRSCATECESPCRSRICKVIEEPMPQQRCCKFVPVYSCCDVTKHVSYTTECPEGYQPCSNEGVAE